MSACKVITYRTLLQAVRRPHYKTEDQYLHICIGQLRHTIELQPMRPHYLLTELGIGHRLCETLTSCTPSCSLVCPLRSPLTT